MDTIKKILIDNSGVCRMIRTIFQGVIGVLIANMDTLVSMHFNGETKTIIVALVMAILSPIMAGLGGEE